MKKYSYKSFLSMLLIFLLLMPVFCFAWNSTGHRIVAQIAYDHLKPNAKRKLNQLIDVFRFIEPHVRNLGYLSTWPDLLRSLGVSVYDTWHYISKPYVIDKTPRPKCRNPENVVWAVNKTREIISKAAIKPILQAQYTSMLIHFVGDIHEPMHCISLFSRRFPKGDAGGTRYIIRYKDYKNLHRLWDDGFGFYKKYFPDKTLRPYQIKRLAKMIERKYPLSVFKQEVKKLDPALWAKESYQIGKNIAYQLPFNARPDRQYIERGRVISQKRLALAGYRLAVILNEIFY